MNHKKLFTRFVMQPASEQERTLIQAFLENDDEGATIVCKYDIPEITRLICLSDTLAAKEYAESLEDIFEGRQAVLEMLASHNDLHETMNSITDAKVALECGDMDDAYQALVRLRGMIEHLRDHERFSLANLL